LIPVHSWLASASKSMCVLRERIATQCIALGPLSHTLSDDLRLCMTRVWQSLMQCVVVDSSSPLVPSHLSLSLSLIAFVSINHINQRSKYYLSIQARVCLSLAIHQAKNKPNRDNLRFPAFFTATITHQVLNVVMSLLLLSCSSHHNRLGLSALLPIRCPGPSNNISPSWLRVALVIKWYRAFQSGKLFSSKTLPACLKKHRYNQPQTTWCICKLPNRADSLILAHSHTLSLSLALD
jgi:hypothetical protein